MCTRVHNVRDSTSHSKKSRVRFFCPNCDAQRCDEGARFLTCGTSARPSVVQCTELVDE
jgi:hypothetical protein